MTKEELLKQMGFNEYKKAQLSCEACVIESSDKQVKQMPRHTCGLDGPNDNDMEKEKNNTQQVIQKDSKAAYNAKVLKTAEELAKIEYEERSTAFCDEFTWDALDQHAQEVAISAQMRAAHAMIDRELKSFEDGYLTAVNHLKGGYMPDWKSTAAKRGLIP